MKLPRDQWHPSLTDDRICDAAESQMYDLGSAGFCVVCGAERDGCEPDARKYLCLDCGKRSVYGAQELVIYL